MDRRTPGARVAPVSSVWNAKDVHAALKKHYLDDIWSAVSFKELELEPHHEDEKYFRRADLLTVFCGGISRNARWSIDKAKLYHQHETYPFKQSPDGWRIGFEIKVSRADLMHDIKQKWKQNPLARLTNEIYVVYPRGLIRQKPHPSPHMPGHFVPDAELPWGMGAIEVYRDERSQWLGSLRAKITKLARFNANAEMPVWFMNRLLLARRR